MAAAALTVAVAVILALGVQIGADGHFVIFYRQVDIFFIHAGQLGFQKIACVVFADIHTEARAAHPVAHVKQGAEKAIVQRGIARAAHSAVKGNHGIHAVASLQCFDSVAIAR